MTKKNKNKNKILNFNVFKNKKKANKKAKKYEPKINRFYEFERLCQKSQRKMKNFLYEELKKNYDHVVREDCADGYLFALGEIPVMLLAHMDTVHDELPREFTYSEDSNIISSPQGIGGDDRCGIYMILEIIKELKCSVLFLNNEECGCLGAKTFAKDFKEKKHDIFNKLNINYMIEFDRRNEKDAVYYDLDNEAFEEFITSASGGHFKTNWGTCSDISYVAPAVGVAAVNLSCGYYKEHTLEHTVNISEMKTNIDKAKMIIQTAVEKPFEWKEDTSWYKKDWYGKYGSYYGYGSSYYGKYYDDAWDDWDYGYNKKTKADDDDVDKYIEENEYEIYFVDEDGVEAVDYFYAFSTHEAIGMFMEAHPFIRYMDVYSVAHTFGRDYTSADRWYTEGELDRYQDESEVTK